MHVHTSLKTVYSFNKEEVLKALGLNDEVSKYHFPDLEGDMCEKYFNLRVFKTEDAPKPTS